MFRKIWYVIVAVVIAMNSQSLVVADNDEQPEDNAQQILIRTKLIEINHTKLRRLGFDSAQVLQMLSEGTFASPKVGKAKTINTVFIRDTAEGNLIISSPLEILDVFCQNKFARILSEPTITTVVGRHASISSGSTIKTDSPPGDKKKLTMHFIGTKLEVEPHLIANNKIRIEYRLDYSSLRENAGSKRSGFPEIDHTMVDTTFEVSSGETFVSGGLLKKSHTGDKSEHFEVVLLVTPELVDGVEMRK